jgi:hypothetical protein
VTELAGSPWPAVLLAVAVQYSYHLYYGPWATASMIGTFTLTAVYFLRTRDADGLVVGHAVFDLWTVLR